MDRFDSVDFRQLSGTWYEVAIVSEVRVRGDTSSAKVEYELDPCYGLMTANHTRRNCSGKILQSLAKAEILDRNRFRLNVYYSQDDLEEMRSGTYVILEVDPFYRWALLSTEDEKRAWILSRTPSMKMTQLIKLIHRLQDTHSRDVSSLQLM
jgi:apolipoprotein D and lipocalin family protein